MRNRPRAAADRRVLFAGLAIAGAAIAAYARTFSVPFVFDDTLAIAENPTIRHLGPPWAVLFPPHGQGLTVEGRPILNLSFALNYAISGTGVWSYHATNLLIHILAGLTLFGIARGTLGIKRGTGFQPMFSTEHGLEAHATFPAFVTALIWTLHPLQTESVTYLSQRAESLMGLFYLLTLYGFIRDADESESGKREAVGGNAGRGRRSRFSLSAFRFPLFSVAACLLGMATKEVMVSAPLVVLLYDRTFVSGSFRAAWRARRRYYLALAGTWLLLLILAGGAGSRGRTAGFGLGASFPAYALTQFEAIAHYLRLAVWPRPLIFDYGAQWVRRPSAVLGDAVLVVGLMAATGWLLVAKTRILRALGFAGASFFLILAPTSFVPLIRQTIAEHRMYLPLAAVVAVLVGALYRFAGRTAGSILGVAAAAACLGLTVQRNEDYRTRVALYRDTAAKRPDNVLAHYNLGMALAEAGRRGEAAAEFEAALRLEPQFPQADYNLGNALAGAGRVAEAADAYTAALRINPNYAEAHRALGEVLLRLGRNREARWHFNAAVLLHPDDTAARRRRDQLDAMPQK